MRDDLRGSLRVLTVSLATPRSLAIAGVAGLAVFAFAVWAPNLGLIWSVATAPDLALVRRAGVLWATLASAGLTLSPGAAVVTVVLAILVGLNIALAVALGGAAGRGIGFGGAGALVGAIGAGCSACGVGILATVLGPAASAAVLAALPLGGLEFGVAGAALLVMALVAAAWRAARSGVCAVA